jgi:hypothetical protein
MYNNVIFDHLFIRIKDKSLKDLEALDTST